MDNFHSGGKKCTVIFSASPSPHMILVVESSTSHPGMSWGSETHLRMGRGRLLFRREGLRPFQKGVMMWDRFLKSLQRSMQCLQINKVNHSRGPQRQS